MGLVFFLMILTLVPFALGPDLNLLARIGPAILWIAAVLSTLIGLDRLFQADEEDGSLDLITASPLPMAGDRAGQGHGALADDRARRSPSSRRFSAFWWRSTGSAMLAVAATLFRGHAGTDLHRRRRCGADRDDPARRADPVDPGPPLMIPTLIFGVSAANAARARHGSLHHTLPDPDRHQTLISGLIATIAAAAALRQGA